VYLENLAELMKIVRPVVERPGVDGASPASAVTPMIEIDDSTCVTQARKRRFEA
jgi:hypothetical protein